MSPRDMIDEDAEPPKRRRPWLTVLILMLVAFVGGSIAMGYALTHWDAAASYLRGRSTAVVPAAPRPTPLALRTPAPLAASSAVALGAVDDRVEGLEARIEAIDARAQAASGNADRAEALLVAFAARRAIDRGVALGFLERLLRERFGAVQPQAVGTVIGAARQPVTLDELRGHLAGIAPTLAGTDPRETVWTRVRREMAGLIVIRRTDTASSAPPERVERALRQVEAGHVDRALVEVARLPAGDAAAGWIAAARRYVATRQALDTLETAALLAPRTTTQAEGVER